MPVGAGMGVCGCVHTRVSTLMCSSTFASARMHACVYICVWMHIHVWMHACRGQRLIWNVFLKCLPPCWFFSFLSQDPSLASSLPICISCLAKVSKDPSLSHSLELRWQTQATMPSFLYWVLGIHLRSSCIHDNNFTNTAVSPVLYSLKQLSWTQYCQLNKYTLT